MLPTVTLYAGDSRRQGQPGARQSRPGRFRHPKRAHGDPARRQCDRVEKAARATSGHFDLKSTKEDSRWYTGSAGLLEKLPCCFVSVDELRIVTTSKDMMVIKGDQRLSIQPVTRKQFDAVRKMLQA